MSDSDGYRANQVVTEASTFDGEKTLTVTLADGVAGGDQATMVFFPNVEFTNGTIDVELAATLRKDAPPYARGFAGLAFRIADDLSSFESFYVRPTNGRADDENRRKHATQYFSFPDYDFFKLRKSHPGVYESEADIGLEEWIRMRVEIQGARGKLYVNDLQVPVLEVDDMKLGSDARGSIGLWVDVGTLAHFRNLSYRSDD